MNSRIQRSVIKVAIIGAGPGGISLAYNLLLKIGLIPWVHVELTMIDKWQRAVAAGPFGPGPIDQACNQRSFSMGLAPDQPRTFFDYLKVRPYANEMDEEALTHPPRFMFGNFLSYTLENLRRQYPERGHKLETMVAEVIDLLEGQDSVAITTSTGERLDFDYVVLTNFPSCSDHYTELLGHENYHHSPYPTFDLAKKIPSDARVDVIGSSLTGVDTVNGLAHMGHLGPITLRSRSGRIPAVLSEGRSYDPAIFTPQNTKKLLEMEQLPLQLLVSMAKEELEHATSFGNFDADWIPRVNESPVEFLERSYHCSQILQPYQSVLRSVCGKFGEQFYRKLSTEDKRLVKSSSLWKSFRHTMARPTAKAFLRLMKSGQASVIGGLKSIEPCDDGSFRVSYQTGPETTLSDQADVIINCTGGSSNVPKLIEKGLACPLICSLVSTGTVTAHPVGGIQTILDRWNVVGSNGKPSNRIYATGNLVSGAVMYVSGMDSVARLTEQIAQALVESWLGILKGALPSESSLKTDP